jgi:hypothetical protein
VCVCVCVVLSVLINFFSYLAIFVYITSIYQRMQQEADIVLSFCGFFLEETEENQMKSFEI